MKEIFLIPTEKKYSQHFNVKIDYIIDTFQIIKKNPSNHHGFTTKTMARLHVQPPSEARFLHMINTNKA